VLRCGATTTRSGSCSERCSAALGGRERDAALMALSRLATCLGEHSNREDEVLYPAAESVSGAFER
jgi:hypothetical protein